MTDKELKRLDKTDLLKIAISQSQKIDALEAEIEELKARLASREIKMAKAGSIADVAMQVNQVFDHAQEAADMYYDNIKKHIDEQVREATGRYLKSIHSIMKLVEDKEDEEHKP